MPKINTRKIYQNANSQAWEMGRGVIYFLYSSAFSQISFNDYFPAFIMGKTKFKKQKKHPGEFFRSKSRTSRSENRQVLKSQHSAQRCAVRQPADSVVRTSFPEWVSGFVWWWGHRRTCAMSGPQREDVWVEESAWAFPHCWEKSSSQLGFLTGFLWRMPPVLNQGSYRRNTKENCCP